MVTYALDASAILRYLDGEAGSERVAEIIKGHLAGKWRVIVSAVHWGEVAGITYEVHGREAVDVVLARLLAFGFEIIPVTGERAVRAALIKVARKIPYVDAIGAELAVGVSEHVFVTADFDLRPARREIQVEFLPRKQ